MARKLARAVDEEQTAYLPLSDLLQIPATDNEPGAVAALLKVNRALRRSRRWPAPYDRTRHLRIGP